MPFLSRPKEAMWMGAVELLLKGEGREIARSRQWRFAGSTSEERKKGNRGKEREGKRSTDLTSIVLPSCSLYHALGLFFKIMCLPVRMVFVGIIQGQKAPAVLRVRGFVCVGNVWV